MKGRGCLKPFPPRKTDVYALREDGRQFRGCATKVLGSFISGHRPQLIIEITSCGVCSRDEKEISVAVFAEAMTTKLGNDHRGVVAVLSGVNVWSAESERMPMQRLRPIIELTARNYSMPLQQKFAEIITGFDETHSSDENKRCGHELAPFAEMKHLGMIRDFRFPAPGKRVIDLTTADTSPAAPPATIQGGEPVKKKMKKAGLSAVLEDRSAALFALRRRVDNDKARIAAIKTRRKAQTVAMPNVDQGIGNRIVGCDLMESVVEDADADEETSWSDYEKSRGKYPSSDDGNNDVDDDDDDDGVSCDDQAWSCFGKASDEDREIITQDESPVSRVRNV